MLVTATFHMPVNIFMLCHSVTHASDLKIADKVVSNQHRFTVIITMGMHLKLLAKVIHKIHSDQTCKYITTYFFKIGSKSVRDSAISYSRLDIFYPFFPAFFFFPSSCKRAEPNI